MWNQTVPGLPNRGIVVPFGKGSVQMHGQPIRSADQFGSAMGVIEVGGPQECLNEPVDEVGTRRTVCGDHAVGHEQAECGVRLG